MRLQDPGMKQDLNNNLFVGYPVNGVHYNYKQVGIWQLDEADLAALYGQKPGEVKVADLDGNGVIDGNDRTILGTTRPRLGRRTVDQRPVEEPRLLGRCLR